ncbi:MAG: hypothetical protein AABZ31_12250 [Bdellovibrionota bacterium]
MLRVALVLDDYNELIYLQTILRKIGIDVEGLQNVKKYEELSLGFNPQILITSAFGKKVNGLEFIKNLHRVRGYPKILVLTTPERPLSKQETDQYTMVDQFLMSPVNPKNMIMAISQVGNVDEKILLEKFEKLQASGFVIDESIQLVGQEEAPIIGETPRFSFRDQGASEPTSSAPGASFKLKKDVNSMASAPLDISPADDAAAAVAQVAAAVTERSAKYQEYLAKIEPLKSPNSTSYSRDRILQMNKKIRSAQPPEDIKEIEHDRKEFVRHLFTKK